MEISPYAVPGVTRSKVPFSLDLADFLLHKLCIHYEVKYEKLNSRTRMYPLFYIRQTFLYWLNEVYGNTVTLKEYGAIFTFKDKSMDHTTVMHSHQRIRNAIKTKELIQAKLKSTADTVQEDYLITSKYLRKCLLEYRGR